MNSRLLFASVLALGVASSLVACGSSSDNVCSTSGQALSVCAKGATVKGVDVSYYQGTVDWTKVKAAGIDFAITRVSDGTGTPDTQFSANWAGIKKAGIVRGLYQFFRPNQDPIAQADLMLSMVTKAGGFAKADLPPVLDIEVTGGLTPAQIQASMQKWLTYVEQKTGTRPLIYTAAFMSSSVGTGFSKYPLWVANYGPKCPTMPSGWNDWVAWQYADNGTVNGISGGVDMDEWNGSLADLVKFADPPTPDAGAPDSGSKDASANSEAGSSDAAAHDAAVPDAAPAADAAAANPCTP